MTRSVYNYIPTTAVWGFLLTLGDAPASYHTIGPGLGVLAVEADGLDFTIEPNRFLQLQQSNVELQKMEVLWVKYDSLYFQDLFAPLLPVRSVFPRYEAGTPGNLIQGNTQV